MDTVLFEKIFREHFPGLVNYASRILRNDLLAEEVVQNVFASLWQKREILNISVSSVSYIYKCVYNACLNTRAHQDRLRMIFQNINDPTSQDTWGAKLNNF